MPDNGNILIGQLKLDITQLNNDVDKVNTLLASIGKDAKTNIAELSNM